MRSIAIVFAIACLLVGPTASAAPAWSQFGFTATPQDAPKVLAAADALMGSEAGQEFPGKLLLQVHVADGSDPATHTFVPIYRSAAEREAFVQKLQADPAWKKFQDVMTERTDAVSQSTYRNLKSWGDLAETDHLWMTHAFAVSDPAAFVAAIDKLLASPTGQKFPGQVYLSAVLAAGLTPVTHVISVGYASEAELEAWLDVRNASADWSTYVDASEKVSEYLGGTLVRDLKSWGPASFADIVGK